MRHNEDVCQHLESTKFLSINDQIKKWQYYLLGAIRDTGVYGSYSNYHEISTYTLGYDHAETIRLAHMWVSAFYLTLGPYLFLLVST